MMFNLSYVNEVITVKCYKFCLNNKFRICLVSENYKNGCMNDFIHNCGCLSIAYGNLVVAVLSIWDIHNAVVNGYTVKSSDGK